ncbi:hypothetical protein DEO72_LG1g2987 [Vigna unguiculata]|uniref:GRF-type domain-containing protein n=1 Tax=Vigna unguiculata TaxID=3917 RepID=A0A4D6KNU6_VIGUN|nr:hypothetical protein DEO72_LG1g2987 [Vigna unguiculata]
MPNCYCGDKAMLRTAKTAKNKGERFWGCPNFKSGGEECGGCNYFSWFVEYGIEEGGSASTIVIEDKCCGDVKNEEKVGGNVKIEENAVGSDTNEALAGGSLNSQEMRRSCVMAQEV